VHTLRPHRGAAPVGRVQGHEEALAALLCRPGVCGSSDDAVRGAATEVASALVQALHAAAAHGAVLELKQPGPALVSLVYALRQLGTAQLSLLPAAAPTHSTLTAAHRDDTTARTAQELLLSLAEHIGLASVDELMNACRQRSVPLCA
jgi:hypothetical protein